MDDARLRYWRLRGLRAAMPALWSDLARDLRGADAATVAAVAARLGALEAALRALVREAAEKCTIRPSETPVDVATVSASQYNTQGLGAATYARGAAGMRAAGYLEFGIRAEVVHCPGRPPDGRLQASCLAWWPGYYDRFVVRVWAHPCDAEILPDLPAPPLREQVRLCWKAGVNPRVFNPFLPHDYEERVGLDYCGGEKAA